MTQENLERGVISSKTFLGVLVSAVGTAVLGTVSVCFFLNGLSQQIAKVSDKVDSNNQQVTQTLTSMSRTEDQLQNGQTAIWAAVKDQNSVLNQHGLSIQELKDAVNRDAAENRAAEKAQ